MSSKSVSKRAGTGLMDNDRRGNRRRMDTKRVVIMKWGGVWGRKMWKRKPRMERRRGTENRKKKKKDPEKNSKNLSLTFDEIVHEPDHQVTLPPARVEPPDRAVFAQLGNLHVPVNFPNPFTDGRLETFDEI
jgi:hypothetical protein